MKASIIVPTKNPGNVFKGVLESVLHQKTEYQFDVLVIDSGSTDGTCEYIHSLQNPNLKLHQIDPISFGHGKTRNLAISMTTGEYAILITHDATPVYETWLSELIKIADSDKDIAGVFGRHVAYPDADPFTNRELKLHFAGFDNWKLVELADPQRYEQDLGYRQFLHFFSDNNALVRRSVWEKIPYPDVNFAEDQLWAKQIIESGYKKAYSKEAVVYHSHNYTLIERLRRSFDESYAFKQLFGYVLCPSLLLLIKSWAALTRRDIAYTREERLYLRNLRAVLASPVDNLMRLLGLYLGSRADRLPNSFQTYLSHDKRLFLGLRGVPTTK